MAGNLWDYLIDGLFVLFLTVLIVGISTTTNSFVSLIYGMFAGTTEQNLAAINTTQQYKSSLIEVLNKGATSLSKTIDAQAQAFPLVIYISIAVLFIGATIGIVVWAMRNIREAREVALPVSPT